MRGDLFSARKTVRAVDDVSFSIAKGETVGIVGESGCGKSTTARLLMHLMTRDAGDIIYDGMQVGRALSLRELRRGIGLVRALASGNDEEIAPENSFSRKRQVIDSEDEVHVQAADDYDQICHQRLAVPINTNPITYPANINVTNVQVPFGA